MMIFVLAMMKRVCFYFCTNYCERLDYSPQHVAETGNVDVDDFYQYIDEDTRVVIPKKAMLNLLLLESGLDVEDYF